ncbi:Sulfate and thiosulfate binding protein CysP [Crocosphaera watsonii WH 0402]|uniref:Sulfate and thiosulfate binding protein CysP n=1 Tax=Crocosphaera watsonii WH 0402 TaxID=1284629 RepID=T2JM19_CROWT|nr:Sulfate and thiosulfate binding protein CysP [Crocosphaera watsonii WH 0402]
MSLINFQLISPRIQPNQLFKAIESVISSEKISQAIASSKSRERRNRNLPTHVIIVLVIAMSFWSSYGIIAVFKNLIGGLTEKYIREKIRLKTPTSSSITEARQRVGPRVMTRLFELIVRPLATPFTQGAFLKGLRLMAVDGTVFDVPDTEKNARVCGYPGTRPGTKAAFPKVRLVLLVEAGTHLICDALISPYKMGERVRVRKLLRSVNSQMLLMWDRGLHSFKMVKSVLDKNCHFLGRMPKNVKFEVVKTLLDGSYISWIAPDRKSKKKGAKRIQVRIIEYVIEEKGKDVVYRLITDLMDVEKFPALLLAKEYHSRWEVENTLSEFKTYLNGRRTKVRSKKPREVIQEIYGWLLAHYSIRCLMFRAATEANLPPLRLSFSGCLRVIQRAIPKFQKITENENYLFFSWLITEMMSEIIPPRQNRSNPRVVKKTRCKFKNAKPIHRGNGSNYQKLTFNTIKAVA